jgi:hypothetical protein
MGHACLQVLAVSKRQGVQVPACAAAGLRAEVPDEGACCVAHRPARAALAPASCRCSELPLRASGPTRQCRSAQFGPECVRAAPACTTGRATQGRAEDG